MVIAISFSEVPWHQGDLEAVYESHGSVQDFNTGNPNPDGIVPDKEDAYLWEGDKAVKRMRQIGYFSGARSEARQR